MLAIFFHPSDWNPQKQTCPFPKALEVEAGRLDINLREITTTDHVWTTFMSVVVQLRSLRKFTRTPNDIIKNINIKFQKVLPAQYIEIFSGLPSGLRNWLYSVLQPLFVLFPKKCLLSNKYLLACTIYILTLVGSHLQYHFLEWDTVV